MDQSSVLERQQVVAQQSGTDSFDAFTVRLAPNCHHYSTELWVFRFGPPPNSSECTQVLVGVHGYGERAHHDLEELAVLVGSAGVCVLLLDMPGFGKSPGKRLSSKSADNTQPGGAVDVVLSVLDTLQVKSAVWCGASWGGGVCLSAALTNRARVSALILLYPSFKSSSSTKLSTMARIPTIIGWAKDDVMHPFKQHLDYKKSIPLCTIVSYAKKSDLMSFTDFGPKVVEFLRQLQQRPSTSTSTAASRP